MTADVRRCAKRTATLMRTNIRLWKTEKVDDEGDEAAKDTIEEATAPETTIYE